MNLRNCLVVLPCGTIMDKDSVFFFFFLGWGVGLQNHGLGIPLKRFAFNTGGDGGSSFLNSTTTTTPYPTRWGRLHGSTSAIMFYQVPYFYPNH